MSNLTRSSGCLFHFVQRSFEGALICGKHVVNLALRPRQGVQFFRAMGRAVLNYELSLQGTQMPQQSLASLFPGVERLSVTLADAEWVDGNLSMQELYYLCAVARHRRIRSALEFGTFNGLVMANLARNTDPNARLITLDLPPEALAALTRALAPGEDVYVRKAQIGAKLQALEPADRLRITQLYGDSMRLDLRPYYGQMDLVFVDASHQYAYVQHDSEEAFRLRSPQGIIFWHDYLAWRDVTRYLNELRLRYPLVRIQGTSLVMYRGDALR